MEGWRKKVHGDEEQNGGRTCTMEMGFHVTAVGG
jgi:hypothetical protein